MESLWCHLGISTQDKSILVVDDYNNLIIIIITTRSRFIFFFRLHSATPMSSAPMNHNCQAIVPSTGVQCRNMAMTNNIFCHSHSQSNGMTAKESKSKSKSKSKFKSPRVRSSSSAGARKSPGKSSIKKKKTTSKSASQARSAGSVGVSGSQLHNKRQKQSHATSKSKSMIVPPSYISGPGQAPPSQHSYLKSITPLDESALMAALNGKTPIKTSSQVQTIMQTIQRQVLSDAGMSGRSPIMSRGGSADSDSDNDSPWNDQQSYQGTAEALCTPSPDLASNIALGKKLFGAKMLDIVRNGYKLTRCLGSGINGQAYLACQGDPRKTRIVIKYQTGQAETLTRKRVAKELKIQKKFYKQGLAPKVVNHGGYYFMNPKTGRQQYVGYIMMAEISGTLYSLLTKDPRLNLKLLQTLFPLLIRMFVRLQDSNLIHGDAHLSNIGYQVNDQGDIVKLLFIDFGRSAEKYALTALDYIGFLLSLHKLRQARSFNVKWTELFMINTVKLVRPCPALLNWSDVEHWDVNELTKKYWELTSLKVSICGSDFEENGTLKVSP
jgi:tRNA A-37 threonylcarbamoyl transferase component Bud32